MADKRILVVKAAADITDAELKQVEATATLFNITPCRQDLTDMTEFNKKLCCDGSSYDYVYLATHANTGSFGDSGEGSGFAWRDFAEAICNAGCLSPSGAILFLGCCRGGLRKVAAQLFCQCWDIDYVCGPRWTVFPEDITTGFHVFLYNMEIRHEQPSTAVSRASAATGYDFYCHDKVELEDEILEVCETLGYDESQVLGTQS